MAIKRSSHHNSWPITMIAFFLVVAVLWAARVVLIPIALAVLLAFLLAPLCDRLEKWGLGRILSVLVVTMMTFIVLGVIGWIVAGQVIDLAGELPRYQDNIRNKIQSVKVPSGGPLSRAAESIRELSDEVLAPRAQVHPYFPETESEEPVKVEVVDDPMRPFETIAAAAVPVLRPLASAGIVIVFVIFILMQRTDLRDRVIGLMGQGRMTIATQAIDDAARRVSRFISMLFIINATYGVAVGVGVYFIGLPNAVLWGVLAGLIRFIPYVGPWVGALLPITFSLAVFDTWTPVFITVALFVGIELISNNVLEPLLYGSRTGLSPVSILASAVFWAWLWGPLGLVLATPLTVCVVVMGRYVPRLEFLNVLLSDQPGLTPSARVYQRLLATDLDDAFELCEKFLEENPLVELYEQVLLPALALAERDRHHGRLEPELEEAVYYGFRYLVEDLGERYRGTAIVIAKEVDDQEQVQNEATKEVTQAVTNQSSTPSVICVSARDVGDEIAGLMLLQILEAHGINVELLPANGLISKMIERIESVKPSVVCISAVPPQAVARTRGLCRRITLRAGDARIMVAFWTMADIAVVRQRVAPCDPARVASTLADAVRIVQGRTA